MKKFLFENQSPFFIMPVLLLGVKLPDNKLVRVRNFFFSFFESLIIPLIFFYSVLNIHLLDCLNLFYGIGHNTAQRLCSKFSIHKTCKVSDLSESQLNAISLELSDMTLESDLRRQVRNNILHHRTIG